VATVFIPTQLRRLTGGRDRLVVAGASVGELIDAIERLHPGFRDRVATGEEIVPGLSVAVDGETAALGLLEPVGPSSEVHFIPALGGG
jgi:molybdopterin synthase sulfur carrier subunit